MDTDVRDIKELAKKFTPEQIEGCIAQQIETGQNICLRDKSAEKIVNELAKAEYVKRLVKKGMTIADALRELASRMRQVQKGF
jgi:phosphoribosyl-ATP pyrophosphohydrolase